MVSEDKGLCSDLDASGFGGVPVARVEREDGGALRSEDARDVERDCGGAEPGVDERETRVCLSLVS